VTHEGQPLEPDNLGFLLAKAGQVWNDLLQVGFREAGFPEVRAAYGSLLLPLFREDGLRQGELARRARLSKQTLTTMSRAMEEAGLVERRGDPADRRATTVHLTARAQAFRPVAERVVADVEERLTASDAVDRDALRAMLAAIVAADDRPAR
jgi:DNA-binding MarR family transcriptional regulator